MIGVLVLIASPGLVYRATHANSAVCPRSNRQYSTITALNTKKPEEHADDKPGRIAKTQRAQTRQRENQSIFCAPCISVANSSPPFVVFVSSWLVIQAGAAISAEGTSRVQKGQTLALSGMLLRQCGQSRVVGSEGSSVLRRLMRWFTG